MRVKRIVTAMMAGCAAVVISAVPGLRAGAPGAPARGDRPSETAIRHGGQVPGHDGRAGENDDRHEGRRSTARWSCRQDEHRVGHGENGGDRRHRNGDPAPDDAGWHDENAAGHDEPHDGAHAGRDRLDGHVPDDETDGRHEALSLWEASSDIAPGPHFHLQAHLPHPPPDGLSRKREKDGAFKEDKHPCIAATSFVS